MYVCMDFCCEIPFPMEQSGVTENSKMTLNLGQ